MKIVELIEVRKPKGFSPKEHEVVLYTLREEHAIQVQSTRSGNPYWHAGDYTLCPGDVVLQEANFVMTVAGHGERDSLSGNFATREEAYRHIEYYLRGEILAIVREDETAPAR